MRVISRVILALLFAVSAHAAAPSAKEPNFARFFGGVSSPHPEELNTELQAQGVEKVKNLVDLGVEGIVATSGFLSAGLRYVHRVGLMSESVATTATSYSATIRQDTLLGVARYKLMGNDFYIFDMLLGLGGSTTQVSTDFAKGEGEWSADVGNGSPYGIAGVSLSLGYKNFFLFVEGGYAYNKLATVNKEGSANANVGSIDLSGGYAVVGIMFRMDVISKLGKK